MLLVVSDTSPLRALHHLGLVGILDTMFGRVLIPPAVNQELSHPSASFTTVDVSPFDFIEIMAPRDQEAVVAMCQMESLDLGEAEALVPAREVNASAVLIDERSGRKVAAKAGL